MTLSVPHVGNYGLVVYLRGFTQEFIICTPRPHPQKLKHVPKYTRAFLGACSYIGVLGGCLIRWMRKSCTAPMLTNKYYHEPHRPGTPCSAFKWCKISAISSINMKAISIVVGSSGDLVSILTRYQPYKPCKLKNSYATY